MTASAIIFYVLASVALIAAALVIWSRNAVHSAVYLVLSFLSVAAIYVLMQAEFVAAVQVLVYAGGIMVLFLFVIMLVNIKDTMSPRVRVHATVSSIVALAMIGLVLYVYGQGRMAPPSAGASGLREGGNLQVIGASLFTDYILPFELTSLLILIALMGAVVFAKKDL